MNEYPAVLVVAGTDSSGDAGLLRDVATLRDLGVGAVCAVTAVSAQTDRRVRGVHLLPAALVASQIETALEGDHVRAVKIGMLGSGEIVDQVTAVLNGNPRLPVVLDPVLASSSGTPLLDAAGVVALRQRLLGRCTLVTPNLVEAPVLAGIGGPATQEKIAEFAQRILALGPQAVLIKGGHAEGELSIDTLFMAGQRPVEFASPRVAGVCRGTGCTLASAIAAGLSTGMTLPAACRRAKSYVGEYLACRSRQG